jgi:hypothetical protein
MGIGGAALYSLALIVVRTLRHFGPDAARPRVGPGEPASIAHRTYWTPTYGFRTGSRSQAL